MTTRSNLTAQTFSRLYVAEAMLPSGAAALDPTNWAATGFTEEEAAIFLLGEARGLKRKLWEHLRSAGAPYGQIVYEIMRHQYQ